MGNLDKMHQCGKGSEREKMGKRRNFSVDRIGLLMVTSVN
jgi:hypothetical protein